MTKASVLLYVPGDRFDRIEKAIASSADGVIIDLEDAVELSNKDTARTNTLTALSAHRGSGRVGVRLNALSSGLAGDDLEALEPELATLPFLVLPMVNEAREVESISALAAAASGGRVPSLIPLLETARGVLNAAEIASVEHVETLALGPADLCNELGFRLSADESELLTIRTMLALACSANGRRAPIDGPYLNVQDALGLRDSSERAKKLGFSGKQAIHPNQLDTIRASFSATAAEISWAKSVHEAFSKAEAAGIGSIKLEDGTFVDYPVARRARAILKKAGQ